MDNAPFASPQAALVDKPIATVLVVDDTPDNLTLMGSLLREHFLVKVANHGEKALKIAQSDTPPDLILLDIMMPEMDGYEVCRRLKAAAATRDIPVIFLTARSDTDDERAGLALGAVDYITKPISPPILLARVNTHLALKATADFLRDKSSYLEREVAMRTLEVQAIQDVTIMAMTSLAETRDNETGNHIRRTQLYVKTLAERLRHHPRFEPVRHGQFVLDEQQAVQKGAEFEVQRRVHIVVGPHGQERAAAQHLSKRRLGMACGHLGRHARLKERRSVRVGNEPLPIFLEQFRERLS